MHLTFADGLARLTEDVFQLSVMVFLGSSLSGIAAQLRAGGVITVRAIVTATLNSGMLGLIIFLMGYHMFFNDLPYLVGVSMLSGIGGAATMDVVFTLIRRTVDRRPMNGQS